MMEWIDRLGTIPWKHTAGTRIATQRDESMSAVPSFAQSNLTGIARQARRVLLGRQVQSRLSGAIEIRIYVFGCDARLRPVRAKIVSPLELQVVLAAGTLVALLEPTRLPNRTSQATEWIVSQVFDRGWEVIGFYRISVLVLQIDFVIVFQVFPKIIRLSVGKVIDDGAVRRRGADLIERSCQMMMIRDIKNTAGPMMTGSSLLCLSKYLRKPDSDRC
jgi:hypothetical protein